MTDFHGIQITGITSEMKGVGRLPDGRAVFIPGTIPGESVSIELTREAGRFANARLLSVEQTSCDRQTPFCPYYGKCGGCSAQHMTYQQTLDCKATIVRDALTRLGGFSDLQVEPTLGMASPLAYRNKVEYVISRDGELGFNAANSHSVIPVQECPLTEAAGKRCTDVLRKWLRMAPRDLRGAVIRTVGDGSVMLILCGQRMPEWKSLRDMLPEEVRSLYFCREPFHPAHALDGVCMLLCGQPTLDETLLGMRFGMSPQAFFQVNRTQSERMLQLGSTLAANVGGTAADVYCGVGTFSLAIASHTNIGHVYGFEIVPQAIENANANATLNGLTGKSSFYCGDAAVTMPKRMKNVPLDTALIDPPRKGAAPEVLRTLITSGARQIVYVSCNPATLARDCKLLSDDYRIVSVQPIDMFPWTEHVETVVLLSRN